MGLETATYLTQLVNTNPTSTDPKSQGDDHLRLVKSVLQNSFPNISGAMTVSHTVLNYLANVTSDVQAQINAKGAIAGQAWTGTHNFTASTITVPTQSVGDNSTNAASTAFVRTEFAPLSNPALTGIPTAPTASVGTNSTQIATTAFVASTAFSAALPSQTGNAGKFVTTDGTNASWAAMSIPAGATIYTQQNFGAF